MGKILMVDDDELLARMMCDYLTGRGHDASHRANAACLVEYMERERPDALVLDQIMPGPTGLETLALLKSSPGLAAIPVIMVTSRRGQDDILDALRAGASDYMTKPVHPEELRVRIEGVLAGRSTDAAPSLRLH